MSPLADAIVMSVTENLSPADVIRRLDAGRSVVIRLKRRSITLMLPAVVLLGLFLVWLLMLMVGGGIEQGTHWALVVFNLRTVAVMVGIVGCLVIVPVGLAARLLRDDSLLLSRDGIVEQHRGRTMSQTFMHWSEIDTVTFESLTARPGFKMVVYRLTPDAVRRRGLRGWMAGTVPLRTGYELKGRRLFEVLSAAHARYSGTGRSAR